MVGTGERRLLTVAVVVLLVTGALLFSASWYLVCEDETGHHLGGLDCFQHTFVPTAGREPARSIGFVPLFLAWSAAAFAVVVIGIRVARRTR
jgi:hypothetical protein